MNRFFIPTECVHNDLVDFPVDPAHQIARVLRLKAGEHVVALDGCEFEMDVVLVDVQPHNVVGRIIERREIRREPRARLTLFLALTQREKFEWMLQKCTEIGAFEFIPVVTTRALLQDTQDISRKLERWQKIVREAAEQSGRGKVPPVRSPIKLNESFKKMPEFDRGLFAWEEEHTQTVPAALTGLPVVKNQRIAVWIGPEGGFTGEEVERAQQAGALPVTLGARILRMETAAITASVLVLHTLGDL